ncbi:MAG: sulfotransferase [Xanthomonadales bacterium]|nr:sulfotransferase [Xanthomonadales bacterium]
MTPSSTSPAQYRQLLGHAFESLRQGQLQQARQATEQLLEIAESSAEVQFLASELSVAEDQPEQALAHIKAANAAAPGQAPLLLKQARILLGMRHRREAAEVARQVAAAAAGDWRTLWNLGQFHMANHDPEQAAELYAQARSAAEPQVDPNLLYDLASAAFFNGEFDAAEAALDQMLQVLPQAGHAWHLRSNLRRQTVTHNHVADLEERLSQGVVNETSRAACLYALAKEYEDLERHDEAFDSLTRAASLLRRNIQYDGTLECAALDSIRSQWTAEHVAHTDSGNAGSEAIFIVGLPRTGTTLLERMLSQHSDVRALGELQDFPQLLGSRVTREQARRADSDRVRCSLHLDYGQLGQEYLRGARELAGDARVFVDKMPVNFMYCGPIQRALPGSRIIHLVRDPMDACHAVYKTLFYQAYHYSYDLRELADYYIAYQRLMAHWHNVMPERVLDVHYEALVTDPRTQMERVLAYCGLVWEDGVLAHDRNARPSTTASAAQVREPVHDRSVGRWRAYAEGLAPLRDRLRAAGIPLTE